MTILKNSKFIFNNILDFFIDKHILYNQMKNDFLIVFNIHEKITAELILPDFYFNIKN